MLRITLPWIWNHPLGRHHRLAAFRRYLWWQSRCLISAEPYAMPWVNGVSLLLERASRGATGNLYCGLHEWPDMAFVLHLLRPADTFADIGANVGSYTLLASGAVGCRTVSFEPVPASFRRLEKQVALNRLQERVSLHRVAVGADAGQLRFSMDRGPMNQVVGGDYAGQAQAVPVQAIDQLPSLRGSACWKLDVEGHEQAVLAGAARTLTEAPPSAILSEDRSLPVERLLMEAGFRACAYNPWTRRLSLECAASGGNQLWVRDLAWVQDRLQAAPPFVILGERI